MLIDRLTSLFVIPQERTTSAVLLIWFSLSLVCALLFGLRGMDGALEQKYIIQDDARQHVFWMQRFTDPELFPDDLIANYYQTVAPSGYTFLYRIGAAAGIDPIRLSKILPILLGLITTAYCFRFTLHVLPVPFAAFLSSLLLNQAIWSRDDIVSATARAFLYPLFLAFLYYLARRKFIPCLVALTLQALFYPSIAFVSAGILALGLIAWRGKRPAITSDKFALWLTATGLAAIVIVLAFYASKTSGFGEVISASQARQMPEFQTGGRVSFFRDDYLFYLTRGIYSGLLPGHIPELLWSAVLFPALFYFKSRLPLLTKINKLSILAQVMISSTFLFVAAHAVLFRLYLPSRYTQHTFRIVLCIVAAITIVTILDALIIDSRVIIGMAITAALIVALVIGSISLPDIPQRRFRIGKDVAFYDFLTAQPKETVIATLDDEADNIPSFTRRSVLVAREYALPYHLRYYSQLRERAIDLINAQYSRDLGEVKRFIEKHRVDLMVVDKKAFEPVYAKRNRLIQQFLPELAERNDPATSALSSVMKEYAVFETERLIVVDAARILKKD